MINYITLCPIPRAWTKNHRKSLLYTPWKINSFSSRPSQNLRHRSHLRLEFWPRRTFRSKKILSQFSKLMKPLKRSAINLNKSPNKISKISISKVWSEAPVRSRQLKILMFPRNLKAQMKTKIRGLFFRKYLLKFLEIRFRPWLWNQTFTTSTSGKIWTSWQAKNSMKLHTCLRQSRRPKRI